MISWTEGEREKRLEAGEEQINKKRSELERGKEEKETGAKGGGGKVRKNVDQEFMLQFMDFLFIFLSFYSNSRKEA